MGWLFPLLSLIMMMMPIHLGETNQSLQSLYTVGVKQSHNIDAMFLCTNLTLHMLFSKRRINNLHSLKRIPGTEMNGTGPAYQPYFGFVEEIPVPTAQEHSEVGQFHLLRPANVCVIQLACLYCIFNAVIWMDFSSKQPQTWEDNHHICFGDSFYC